MISAKAIFRSAAAISFRVPRLPARQDTRAENLMSARGLPRHPGQAGA
jgi:hypothetical protein